MGGLSKSVAQGSALGSLLGGPPNQARAPTTLVGCSQLLRLGALAHCLGRPEGSWEPAGTPELEGAVTLIVPRSCNVLGPGHRDLISLISPTGRTYFPPILWRRKLRTGEGNPVAQVLQLGLAPTSQEKSSL